MKRKLFSIKTILLICLSLFLTAILSPAIAQDAVMLLEADKKEISIGEQLKLHLEIKAPVTAAVRLPVLKDTLTGQVEILEVSNTDTIFPDNEVTSQIITIDLLVTSFDTGYQVIPPLTAYVGEDSVSSRAILINVKTVLIDDAADIKDIKEPLDVPFSLWEWLQENWMWPAGVLLLIALIAIYFIYFHNKEKKPAEVILPPAPPKPAHVLALEKLKNTEEKKLWQHGQLKEYHSELSEILREYLENRYRVNALEQTSEEIFHHLRYLDVPDPAKNQLRQVLMLSDMVKFAKEKPVASENELSLSNAREFVQATKETPIDPVDVKPSTEQSKQGK